VDVGADPSNSGRFRDLLQRKGRKTLHWPGKSGDLHATWGLSAYAPFSGLGFSISMLTFTWLYHPCVDRMLQRSFQIPAIRASLSDTG
jgi:hypothetical protein